MSDKFDLHIIYTIALYEVQARLLRQIIKQFKEIKEIQCHISFVDNGFHIDKFFLERNYNYLSTTLKQNFIDGIKFVYNTNNKTSPLLLFIQNPYFIPSWVGFPDTLNYENLLECDPLEFHIWFYYYFMRDSGFPPGTLENQQAFLEKHLDDVFDFLPEFRINHHEKIDYPNIIKDVLSLKTFCNGAVPIYLLQEILEHEYPYFPLYKILALLYTF